MSSFKGRSHNPERFADFEEYKDGKGFSIRERGRVIDFNYDSEKGWFDEFGNYYNKDGEAGHPSKESLRIWN